MRIFMSCFTLTWQDNRTLFCCSVRLRWPTSVGRTSPPPSSTTHLHSPQVPPPPQAEGRNIFWLLKVLIRVEPPETTKGFFSSLLMTILTSPEVTSLDCANNNIKTSSNIIRVNATTEVII